METFKRKGITAKWFLTMAANRAALGIMAFMILNFAFAPWSWNPVEDFLYVRSDALLLPANHISSALAVGITALAFALRKPDKAAHYMFVIFSTASIHEYILDFLNWAANMQFPSYIITFRWFFWLGFFLVPGLLIATAKERRTLYYIAAFLAVYITAWFAVVASFNIDTMTILAYAPGPAYRDFVPNFYEVTSWVIPTSFWWIRR